MVKHTFHPRPPLFGIFFENFPKSKKFPRNHKKKNYKVSHGRARLQGDPGPASPAFLVPAGVGPRRRTAPATTPRTPGPRTPPPSSWTPPPAPVPEQRLSLGSVAPASRRSSAAGLLRMDSGAAQLRRLSNASRTSAVSRRGSVVSRRRGSAASGHGYGGSRQGSMAGPTGPHLCPDCGHLHSAEDAQDVPLQVPLPQPLPLHCPLPSAADCQCN